MIIRLAPDLVDEIKRVEEQGSSARIKFDANPNNPAGNVINVGTKDFRFTWSREPGDLCDIYEQRQGGEEGNGLLVETGCAWRKLNVQRVLDESTKNHVKMRSEEAVRKSKSRKAIVLEPGNPSMQSQMKALAAAETNPWRTFKAKKEPPLKKRKTEPPPGVLNKSGYKSGLSTTTPSKSKPSASPLSTPPEYSGAPASPVGIGSNNLTKGHGSVEDVTPTQAKRKSTSSEKESTSKDISTTGRDKSGHKGNMVAKPTDLRSLLISLLKESHPKGMSFKALEKAVVESMPNSVKQIETVIKRVANYQAPGRYFLKPGVETDGFTKPPSEFGSSPEDHHPSPAPEKFGHQPDCRANFSARAETNNPEEQIELNSQTGHESNPLENIEIQRPSPQLFGERKASDKSEGPTVSSSDSGSDSDSESDSSDSASDSQSHSRSRSKSRSPVGSGSGSSSDSESDASSNSKEASEDEDVDIMSDDDKESKLKLQVSELRLSGSPTSDRIPNHEAGQIEIDGKQDEHNSDLIDIEKDLPDDEHEAGLMASASSVPDRDNVLAPEESKLSSPDHDEHQNVQVCAGRSSVEETVDVEKVNLKHEKSMISERYSGKPKRASHERDSDDRFSKRLKPENLNKKQISGSRNSLLGESPHSSSPDRPSEAPYRVPSIQMDTRPSGDETTDSAGVWKGYHATYGRSIPGAQQPGRKSIEYGARSKTPNTVERPIKHSESSAHGVKNLDRSPQINEALSMQKEKAGRGANNEDLLTSERRPRKVDSNSRKHEILGKFKESGPVGNPNVGYSPKDSTKFAGRSPKMNGRGIVLQRELSDLELGELREPVAEVPPGSNKQFERTSSFKQSGSRPTSSDYWNSDLVKGKPAVKTTADSRKMSPPNLNVPVSGIAEGSYKRRTPEQYAEEFTKHRHRISQPPSQLDQSRADRTEVGAGYNKPSEASSKNGHIAAGRSFSTDLEVHGDTIRKMPPDASLQQDGGGVSPLYTKESRRHKSFKTSFSNGKRKKASLSGSNDGGQKRRESSSDENSCPYSKYDKEEPELKGPIKDFSQYKEYVEEYQEKYGIYISLNKILESYREEFSKYGKELEDSKGKDIERYNEVLRQMRQSYRQCSERHKRLKKTFVVLHEELKHLKEMIKDFASGYTKDS